MTKVPHWASLEACGVAGGGMLIAFGLLGLRWAFWLPSSLLCLGFGRRSRLSGRRLAVGIFESIEVLNCQKEIGFGSGSPRHSDPFSSSGGGRSNRDPFRRGERS